MNSQLDIPHGTIAEKLVKGCLEYEQIATTCVTVVVNFIEWR